jgi:hypothetical protein
MALDAAEVVVAGTGHLWLAPVGTTLPAENSDPTAALASAFVELGYFAEDGATLAGAPEISEFNAWQSTTAIRRSRKLQVQTISGDLLQWNENTVVAAFGGGEITNAGGFYTYTFPQAGDALAEYSAVLDVQDGDRNLRIVVPRMNSGLEEVSSQFNKDNMAVLPISLSSLASDTPTIILFDDAAAFVPSS